MSLIVLTGGVRAGKSALAERLAASRGSDVMVAAAGWGGDDEMERRIEAHRLSRPDDWTTVAAQVDPSWIASVPRNAVLLLDCLGTLVAHSCFEEVGEAEVAPLGAEAAVADRVGALVTALIDRHGDTIVVSNETGWGVVPEWPSARIFRDVLGRATRRLVDASDAAFLVVDGRCLDLKVLPSDPGWPAARREGER
jgi:adenosylcobinamide kinase/adenosylcobinamide-phosphate guanylyltransferase